MARLTKEKQCFSKTMGTENLPLSCNKEAIIIDERCYSVFCFKRVTFLFEQHIQDLVVRKCWLFFSFKKTLGYSLSLSAFSKAFLIC